MVTVRDNEVIRCLPERSSLRSSRRVAFYVWGVGTLLLSATPAIPDSVTYEYDQAGRLRKVMQPGVTQKTYTLDPAGNRVSLTTENLLPDTTAPSAPTITSSSLSGTNTISLAWSASTDTGGSGLAGYRVYRSCPGGVIATTTVLSYVDTTAGPPGATCSYTVSAYDNANNSSAASNAVTYTLPAPPAAPGTISGPTSTTSTTFTLSWASVATTTYYEVWDTTGTGFLQATVTVANVSITRPQCVVYRFNVKACNALGCSAYSPTKQVRVDKPVSCI